ncbi:MAG: hypothetical protein FWC85_03265, partial [Elusimicrobia bacterium]|nr:hypothetical protein [Elusimicrobiota bacterium]
MKIEIPDNYKSVVEKIRMSAVKAGYNAYAAGGFVRDIVLGRPPKDLDIMAERLQSSDSQKLCDLKESAQDGINLAKILSKDYNLSEPVVFERFGTAKLIIDAHEVEFVMPRSEYYNENSRNPETEAGTLLQDALRRDFTVNALFLRLNDMEVLDLTGMGFSDI